MEFLKLMNLEKGLFLTSQYDDCVENPRDYDEGSVWNIYTWARNCYSIDENPYENIKNFLSHYFSEDYIHRKLWNKGGWNLDAILTGFSNKNMTVEPISKYEHTLVKFYRGIGYGWDDGVVGFAVLNKEKLKKIRNIKRLSEKIIKSEITQLDRELELYTDWCNGNTYSVRVTDLQDNLVHSIGGFYGHGADKEEILDIAGQHFDIGYKDEWEEYSEKIFNENFKVQTAITRR